MRPPPLTALAWAPCSAASSRATAITGAEVWYGAPQRAAGGRPLGVGVKWPLVGTRPPPPAVRLASLLCGCVSSPLFTACPVPVPSCRAGRHALHHFAKLAPNLQSRKKERKKAILGPSSRLSPRPLATKKRVLKRYADAVRHLSFIKAQSSKRRNRLFCERAQ